MPIYTGTIKEMGSGNYDGDNANAMYVVREYIDIGEEHLRKVRLSQYLDDTLVSAMKSGEPVTLSAFHLIGFPQIAVCSIKLSDGRVRTSDSFFISILFCFLFMPVLGLLAGVIISIVLSLVISSDWAITVGIICGILYAAHGIIGYLKAKSAF